MTNSPSLLDDLGFLKALDEFDVPLLVTPMPAGEPHWVYDPPPPPPPSLQLAQLALGVIGVGLMMGLGAACAALVFQDQVAQILR